MTTTPSRFAWAVAQADYSRPQGATVSVRDWPAVSTFKGVLGGLWLATVPGKQRRRYAALPFLAAVTGYSRRTVRTALVALGGGNLGYLELSRDFDGRVSEAGGTFTVVIDEDALGLPHAATTAQTRLAL